MFEINLTIQFLLSEMPHEGTNVTFNLEKPCFNKYHLWIEKHMFYLCKSMLCKQ